MKRLLVLTVAFLSCIVLTGFVSIYASESLFPDISGHWAEEYITELADKGIVSGMNDGMFHPDSAVTTAQFTAMIMRSYYGDIDPINEYWASGYLDKAYKQEIIIANDFDFPDTLLQRSSAARIGHEALFTIFGEDDEPDVDMAYENLPDFLSCRTCIWHVGQFYIKGIMIGRPDGLFHNDDFITRAEASVVLMKMLDPSLRNPPSIVLPENKENGKISPDEALRILKFDKTALLIDVRPKESRETGYIPDSISIPLSDIMDNIEDTEIPADKNTVIIVYCQKGSSSQKAYEILKEAGYANVYNLGGIADWPYEIDGVSNP